jgi:hypothetical protein
MDDFNVDTWMSEAGISEKGRKKLSDAEISDEISIEFMDKETLLSVRLAPGDFVRFSRAQVLLQEARSEIPKLEDQNPRLPIAKKDEKGDQVIRWSR